MCLTYQAIFNFIGLLAATQHHQFLVKLSVYPTRPGMRCSRRRSEETTMPAFNVCVYQMHPLPVTDPPTV